MKLKYLLPLITTALCLGGVFARYLDGYETSYFCTYLCIAIIGTIAGGLGAAIDFEFRHWE